MKSFTDLEQSKELAKILPSESADMFWLVVGDTPRVHVLTDSLSNYSKWENYPCWSLAALLRVIPKHIKDYNVLRIDISDKDFAIWYDEIGYGVNNELPDITEKSAVDACVNMIITLYEHKLLNK